MEAHLGPSKIILNLIKQIRLNELGLSLHIFCDILFDKVVITKLKIY